MNLDYQSCPKCQDYCEVRMGVLAPAMAERCVDTGENGTAIVDRFMAGVHDRHLSGLPILPAVTT